jgi:hypothetical protein
MLDELRPLLSAKTVSNLRGRLNDTKRPEQLIGAEMELGLLWGMGQTAKLQVEPQIPDSSRVPEAYSENLWDDPPRLSGVDNRGCRQPIGVRHHGNQDYRN